MAMIKDGFSSTITFADNSSVEFYEKEVTPPSIEGGGPIEQTTMLNTAWRTKYPKTLKDVGPAALTVAYDPAVIDTIKSMVNQNQLITVTFPDDTTLAFWGWLDSFKPNALVEGEQPTAEVVLEASNLNGSDVETAPVYAS